jgi:hypothetical protein
MGRLFLSFADQEPFFHVISEILGERPVLAMAHKPRSGRRVPVRLLAARVT